MTTRIASLRDHFGEIFERSDRDPIQHIVVVTYEFENVDVEALRGLRGVRPSVKALEVAQDRVAEKSFVEAVGGRPAPFWPIDSLKDLKDACKMVGAPAILKPRRFGHDGKGQGRIRMAGASLRL